MSVTLLIAWAPGETRGIVTESGRAIELRIERDQAASLVGARFVGRVARVVPALGAAFVDLGLSAPAFLPLRARARHHLTEGAAIGVVVTKDARDTKPPEVRRLGDAEVFPDQGPVPRRLDVPAAAVVRLLASLATVPFDAVVVNDADTLLAARRSLRETRPDVAERVSLEQSRDLFDAHGIGDAFASALSTRVPLANGAMLTFEHTAAALMIDVDRAQAAEAGVAADRAILNTNLAAADAVGRELRMRGVGGAIVVDFISMRDKADRQRVWDRLALAIAGDPTPVELHGWTRLGHFEITRQRGRLSLAEIMLEPGEMVATPTTVALTALARISVAATQPGPITLRVAAKVADLLEGTLRDALEVAIRRCGRRVVVERLPDQDRTTLAIDGI